MQGASRGSFAAARERLDALLSGAGAETVALGEELFGASALLDREISLRRALSDPASSGDRRAALVRDLLAGQLGAPALEVLGETVSARWSRARDLVDAVELLAVQATLAAAEQDGELDDVEDELFRFGRIVAGDAALRGTLVDRTIPAERRADLVRSLLADRVKPVTLRLVTQIVAAPRGRSLEQGLEEYAAQAAARRQRVVGVVRTAVALTDEQKTRLQAALRATYGHDVALNVVVDPAVVGGLSVQVGDELVEGTIASRLDQARKRLAG